MSIVVGTGKNARVRFNTGELQNVKEAEKKAQTTEPPAKVGKGNKGGKGAKSETPVTETQTTETPANGNENQESND